jgi:deoxyribonuclease-4
MLKFLVAGIPHTTFPRNTLEGIRRVAELGLDGMELEWVHQVPYNEDMAGKVKILAKQLNVVLTVHGSYYINLASDDDKIWHASISRIAKALKIGSLSGASKLTFHIGFYQNHNYKKVISRVEEGLKKIIDLSENPDRIIISPELTGKMSQVGTLEELVTLASKLKIGFCIDFSHLHARTNGKYNSSGEIQEIINLIKKRLGSNYLNTMYFHLSGILYSVKGERRHVCFLESADEYKKLGISLSNWDKVELPSRVFQKGGPDIEWKMILETLKKNKIGGYLVCESPSLEQDTLLLKRFYNNI